jgi:hypothetical protein
MVLLRSSPKQPAQLAVPGRAAVLAAPLALKAVQVGVNLAERAAHPVHLALAALCVALAAARQSHPTSRRRIP